MRQQFTAENTVYVLLKCQYLGLKDLKIIVFKFHQKVNFLTFLRVNNLVVGLLQSISVDEFLSTLLPTFDSWLK